MKTKKYLIWMMMILSVLVIACDKDDDPTESCDGEDIEENTALSCPIGVETIATFCSDGENKSYFTYEGVDYYCDGVSESTCDDAIDEIIAILLDSDCTTAKKSGSMEDVKIELTEMAKNLLEEVRTESFCK